MLHTLYLFNFWIIKTPKNAKRVKNRNAIPVRHYTDIWETQQGLQTLHSLQRQQVRKTQRNDAAGEGIRVEWVAFVDGIQ